MKIEAEIPDELAPWIAGVFKELYPNETEGLGPSASIKAVITMWVKSTLLTYETDRARASGDALVKKAESAKASQMEAAQKKVAEAVKLLDGPSTVVPTQEGV